MGLRVIRLVAIAVMAVSAATVVTASPARAISWSYSCQTVYRDFKFDGGGYSGWGLTLRVQTGGCWSANNTTWLQGSQIATVTRWWQNDASLYRESLKIAPPPAQSYSSVTAQYRVSAWYTSPYPQINYNASYRQVARVEIHNSSNPTVGNWMFSMSCPFVSGYSWVTNCSLSWGTLYKSGIVATYV
jgi:hypothetical protein